MIDLSGDNLRSFTRQSSKGNQLKFEKDGVWYKADYAGYEGLVEYVVSSLLKKSGLGEKEFVVYETEQIKYDDTVFLGCKSDNFLPNGSRIITIERLYKNTYGDSFQKAIWSIREDIKKRFLTLVDVVERITGLDDFGEYLSKLIMIDGLFLNEDRHFHNIAVLMDEAGEYSLCPIFDQGAALLSDTRLDYPLGEDLYKYYEKVKSKTISQSFDEQMDAVDEVCPDAIEFSFSHRDVEEILDREPYYSDDIKTRVRDIIFHQMRRYEGYFKK